MKSRKGSRKVNRPSRNKKINKKTEENKENRRKACMKIKEKKVKIERMNGEEEVYRTLRLFLYLFDILRTQGNGHFGSSPVFQ